MSLNTVAISRISTVMQTRGISVARLSKMSGISQPTLHRTLASETDLTMDRFELLCKTLEVEAFDMLRPKKKAK